MNGIRVVAVMVLLGTAVPAWSSDSDWSASWDFEVPGAGVGEVPPDWGYFSPLEGKIMVTEEKSRSGEQAVLIEALSVADKSMGIVYEHPVEEGERYELAAHVINSRENPLRGTFEGFVSIEWCDALGEEIDRVVGDRWKRTLSKMTWKEMEVSGKAPEGAVKGRFVVTIMDGKRGSTGCCFIDDILVRSK